MQTRQEIRTIQHKEVVWISEPKKLKLKLVNYFTALFCSDQHNTTLIGGNQIMDRGHVKDL